MPIVVSSETAYRYPIFFNGLVTYSNFFGTQLEIIETLNPWVRDFMPVFIEQEFIQFRYDPPYHKNTKYWEPSPTFDFTSSKNGSILKDSTLVLDGGAILIDSQNKIVFISEAFYNEGFKDLFAFYNLKLVFLLPDPDDFTGHLDGVYRIINGLFLYSSVLDTLPHNEWHLTNVQVINKLGYQMLPIPDMGDNIDLDTFRGTYMNFLIIGNSVLLPRTQTDSPRNLRLYTEKMVEECFSKLFGLDPFWVECQEPTEDGGSLHCLTYYH